MGGGRALRGRDCGSDLLSDSAAAIASGGKATAADRGTGAERVDAGSSDKSGRTARESEIILGFGKWRWSVGGLDGGVATFG